MRLIELQQEESRRHFEDQQNFVVTCTSSQQPGPNQHSEWQQNFIITSLRNQQERFRRHFEDQRNFIVTSLCSDILSTYEINLRDSGGMAVLTQYVSAEEIANQGLSTKDLEFWWCKGAAVCPSLPLRSNL